MFWLTFLHQIFFQLCFHLKDFTKIVRLLSAGMSIKGLTYSCPQCLEQYSDTNTGNFRKNDCCDMYMNESGVVPRPTEQLPLKYYYSIVDGFEGSCARPPGRRASPNGLSKRLAYGFTGGNWKERVWSVWGCFVSVLYTDQRPPVLHVLLPLSLAR